MPAKKSKHAAPAAAARDAAARDAAAAAAAAAAATEPAAAAAAAAAEHAAGLPFTLPLISDKAGSWGPDAASLPAEWRRIPYSPFNKADRLGRIADWTAPLGPDGLPFYHSEFRSAAAAAAGAGASGFAATGAAGAANVRRERGGDRRAGAAAAAAAAAADAASALAAASAFTYQASAEDDASFSVVDRAGAGAPLRKPAARGGRGGAAGPSWGPAAGADRRPGAGAPAAAWGAAAAGAGAAAAAGRPGSAPSARPGSAPARGGVAARRGAPAGRFADRRELRTREASIKVGNAWTVVEEFDFGRLNKLFYEYEDPQDIAVHGSVQYVDRTYERVSAKNERPLVPVEKTLSNVTASEDPVIQDMARDAEGPTVFATDLVLAALMSATRSVYSFDIVVTKKDDKLFLDKRDGSALDFVTVNENAADPPVEGLEKETNINSPQALAFEASHINRTFAQQILRDSERVEFANSNPFAHGEAVEAVASAAYRYRRWDLGTVKLVARTQLDAAVQHAGAGAQADEYPADIQSSTFPEKDTVFAIVRSLNEFDSRAAGSGGAPDWRQKLDVQRGAVVATELKNNANKLARWTLEGVLSGASQIRLGFVSRASPRDRKRHVILGMTTLKPYDFAAQINVNIGAGWGVVKAFIDFCYGNLQNGKYVLLRDPNKPVLRLYHVVAAQTSNIAGAVFAASGFAPEDDESAAASAAQE